jgi:hypothetical protein
MVREAKSAGVLAALILGAGKNEPGKRKLSVRFPIARTPRLVETFNVHS